MGISMAYLREPKANRSKIVGSRRVGMDRQQVMAIFFTVLMLGSMVAYGAASFI